MSSTPPVRLTAEDLEWETPRSGRSGELQSLLTQIGDMRAALQTRRGQWAVVASWPGPTQASVRRNSILTNAADDSRLVGLELAARKVDGGSRLYVRAVPA